MRPLPYTSSMPLLWLESGKELKVFYSNLVVYLPIDQLESGKELKGRNHPASLAEQHPRLESGKELKVTDPTAIQKIQNTWNPERN